MILCEVAGPITGEAPPRVHLLDLQGMGHLDLQNRIVQYSLLKVTGDVQPLIFLVRRFNLLGISVLIRRGILRVRGRASLIVRSTSGGDECCRLVKLRLVTRGLAGSLLLTG